MLLVMSCMRSSTTSTHTNLPQSNIPELPPQQQEIYNKLQTLINSAANRTSSGGSHNAQTVARAKGEILALLQLLRNSSPNYSQKFNTFAFLWLEQYTQTRQPNNPLAEAFRGFLKSSQIQLLQDLETHVPNATSRGCIATIEKTALTAAIRYHARKILAEKYGDGIQQDNNNKAENSASDATVSVYSEHGLRSDAPSKISQPSNKREAHNSLKRPLSSDTNANFARKIKKSSDNSLQPELLRMLEKDDYKNSMLWTKGYKEDLPIPPEYIQDLSEVNLHYNHMQSSDLKRDYVVTNTLHRGGFGKVRYAVSIQNNEFCAVKVSRYKEKQIESRETLFKKSNRHDIAPTPLKNLSREWEITSEALGDQLRILDTITVKDKQYTIFQPLMHGNIDNIVHNAPMIERLNLTLALGYKIARSIESIHAKGIVHCDLKNNNILWRYNDKSNDIDILVSDFGQAFRLNEGPLDNVHLGTYINPRVLFNRLPNKSTDAWSFGHMLFDMMCPNIKRPLFLYQLTDKRYISKDKSRYFFDIYVDWHHLVKGGDGKINRDRLKDLNPRYERPNIDDEGEKLMLHFSRYFSGFYMLNEELTQYLMDHVIVPQEQSRHTIGQIAEKLKLLRDDAQIPENLGRASALKTIQKTPEIQAHNAISAYKEWLTEEPKNDSLEDQV